MLENPAYTSQGGQPFLIDVMSKRDKLIFAGLVTLWLISLVFLWEWFLQPIHRVSWSGTIITSLLLGWQTILPGYYFWFVARMKRSNPDIPIPSYWRVAMIVTKAPSEPWSVLQRTLEAMLAQEHPHDTWIADEDPQPEAIAWCKAHGVQISSRKGVAEYHRPNWPRRTRSKEGNLAYFYDFFGYASYDVVVQLDADHVPEQGYLKEMIRPFVDPRVGYVAAPSICDANAGESWVVNARAYAEGSLHGSLQAGYNNGWAPLCIGSHYAIRTVALREIGGVGPELAEDHSTTFLMNAAGWRGVFALDAEAHGDGPACFSDFLIQEFQWARSLTTLLLTVTPYYLRKLPPHLQLQFLFAQVWYPLYALSMGIGVLLPVIALLRDEPLISVNYLDYVARSFLVTFTCVSCVSWIARRGWFRPQSAKVISWETFLFQLARWPWVAAGIGNSIVAWLMRKELSFRITPKGDNAPRPLPLNVLLPYLAIAIGSALAVITINHLRHAQGYYFLTLLNSLFYTVVCLGILKAHIYENMPKAARYIRQKLAIFVALGCLATALGMKAQASFSGILQPVHAQTEKPSLNIANRRF